MKKTLKKRGQKIIKRWSKASAKVEEEGREHIKENLIERISHIKDIRLLILEWAMLITALILLAVTQAFWFGDSYAENTFTSGGNYTEATLGEVNSMNPLFATTNSEKALSRLMFATISTVDYSGHLGIGLAKSILPSENGKVWTVQLRDGLKWSDGEAITNADVIFTVNLIQNPAVDSIYDANFANVKVAENENGEIVFTLSSAYADFLSALNVPVLPKHRLENVAPKTLIEDSFSSAPVTSGAFNLNAVQIGADGKSVVYLSANPNYYKGTPMLSSFAIHTYDTIDEIINAVNGGNVTATSEISGGNTTKITSNQFLEKNASINSGAFLFFNTTSAAVKNTETRKAIRQGLNWEKIREVATGTTPLDYPILSSQFSLESYPTIPSYDFAAAQTKIAEINGGETKPLNLVTVNKGYLPEVTTEIAEELRALGFEVNVSFYEENQEFISNIISKRNYDILIYEAELGADPDPLAYYHSSQASIAGLNLSNYRNSIVDDLLLGARDSLDSGLRMKKFQTFLDYWVNDVPAIGIYQANLTYYYNKNVRTFGNDVRLVTALDRFTDVENWAVEKTTKNRTP